MTSFPSVRSDRGFTLVEMIVAMGIMVTITGVIFSLVDPSRGAYRMQPEVSDLQQRLRVGTQFLADDLIMAGAGSPAGSPHVGTLTNFFAPIQPYRIGMISSDPDNGIFYRTDAITMRCPTSHTSTSVTAVSRNPNIFILMVFTVPTSMGTVLVSYDATPGSMSVAVDGSPRNANADAGDVLMTMDSLNCSVPGRSGCFTFSRLSR